MKLSKKIGLGLGLSGLLCSLASAQTYTRLIGVGDIIVGGEPGETVTRVDNVEINNNGDWAVEVDGSGDTLSDAYTLVNGVIAFEEGTSTGVSSPAGFLTKSIDSMELNDMGDQMFIVIGTTPTDTNHSILVRNGMTLYEEGVSVCTAAGPANGLTYTFIAEAWQNNNDQLLVNASVDDAGATKYVYVVVNLDPVTGAIVSETLLAMQGETLPGHANPIQGFSANYPRNGINDNGDVWWMVDDVQASAADNPIDSNIYINSTQLYNEGDTFPVNPTVQFGHFSTHEMDMNDAGDFVWSGYSNESSSTGSWSYMFKVVGGVTIPILEKTGPAPAAVGGGWLVQGSNFGGVVPISDDGDIMYFVDWDDPDTTIDSGLFFNDAMLMQEGVTILDGIVVDGVADGDTELAMSDDGSKAIVELIMLGTGDVVYMIENMGAATGTAFCNPANVNSTGLSTTLSGYWMTGGGIGGGLSDLHLECVN
ncbi:MAG: hypothetical protein KDB61_04110, partial [Planctomycetes bacterium]|nr:hypothetical protein [Planctomycetota bacterium]